MTYSTPRLFAHCIESREAFDKVAATPLVNGFPPDMQQVWLAIKQYYGNDVAIEKADLEAIFDRVCTKFPRYEDAYRRLEADVAKVPLSRNNFLRDLADQIKAGVTTDIVQHLLAGHWDKARGLFEDTESDLEVDGPDGPTVYSDISVDDVILNNDMSHRVQLSPAILNEYVGGGVPQPCHILVFGRPDMGKTSFMLNLVKGFCEQGKKVLYYSNEDNPQTFLMRAFTVFCGVPQDKVEKYPNRVKEILDEKAFSNFRFVASEAGDIEEINRLCSEFKPDVLIIDQLRNLSGSGESRTLQLETLARAVRTISRRHSLIAISVSQAGESAAGKSYLTQEDLDYSKTGVQGALDLMMGLGASDNDALSNFICVSFPKNKFAHLRYGPKLSLDYATGVYANE